MLSQYTMMSSSSEVSVSHAHVRWEIRSTIAFERARTQVLSEAHRMAGEKPETWSGEDSYVESEDDAAIIREFPIKHSGIRALVAKALEFGAFRDYERAVQNLLKEDESMRRHAARYCGGLSDVLEER